MVVEVSKIETISVLNKPDVIHIGYDLIQGYIAQDIISSINNVSNYVIITDKNLAPLYLEALKSSIQACLTNTQRILVRILPSGEQSKSRETKADIEDFLLNSSCTRDTCLIALGGGVIGDLVGYVASTFMRGIPFVQVPTTLLAMVDSSIGGKTAIDTPQGKNLIGTFWQPRRIYMDLSVLRTLPEREIANGMAEVIKTTVIGKAFQFTKVFLGQKDIYAALSPEGEASDQEYLAGIIRECAKFKADVVTRDEKEGGLRGILNFGHSIGHAFEAILSPQWLHGECVSMGLVLEAQISCNLGHCPQRTVDQLAMCLELYGLPVALDDATREKLCLEQVLNIMKIDKKNRGAQKKIVLLKSIAETKEDGASDVPNHAVEHVLTKYAGLKTLPKDGSHNSITHQQQHPVSHPHLNIISVSDQLNEIVARLFDILNKRFQCTLITSKDKPTESSEEDNVYIYFTTVPGSTTSQHKTWYEYVVLEKDMDYHFHNGAMAFITDTIYRQQQRHVNPNNKKYSSFVTLTVPSYAPVMPVVMDQWLENTDAIEFRVDLLNAQSTDEDWIKNAGKELAHLRQRTKLPIVYTVRTSPQAGTFDPQRTELYLKLVEWAHRWGCDYVDFELTTFSDEEIEQIMDLNRMYPTSKLVASFHDPKHMYPWSSPTIEQVYQKAHQLFQKYSHDGVIKLVGFAETFYDNIELEQFRYQVDPDSNRALILINMGSHGKLSRATNRFLSPATHPTLPSVAAPGQLSVSQLARIRRELDVE